MLFVQWFPSWRNVFIYDECYILISRNSDDGLMCFVSNPSSWSHVCSTSFTESPLKISSLYSESCSLPGVNTRFCTGALILIIDTVMNVEALPKGANWGNSLEHQPYFPFCILLLLYITCCLETGFRHHVLRLLLYDDGMTSGFFFCWLCLGFFSYWCETIPEMWVGSALQIPAALHINNSETTAWQSSVCSIISYPFPQPQTSTRNDSYQPMVAACQCYVAHQWNTWQAGGSGRVIISSQ